MMAQDANANSLKQWAQSERCIQAEGARKFLTVNAGNLSEIGNTLLVEILDAATGQPLPGFATGDCTPLGSDGLEARVAWKGAGHLPAGKPIRIRFHLRGRDARLYSFGFRTD